MTSATDLMNAVNKALGTDVVRMGSHPDYVVEYRPTGLLPFDILLQGGMPRGRMVEVFGDYSTLKTYLGLYAIASTQQAGGTAALIDTEHAFEPEWAASCGVDVQNLIMPPTETGEEAMDAAEALIRGNIDLIVVDSVAATLPQAEQQKRLHKESIQPARQAHLMSAALRRLTAANKHTSMLWINQTRLNIGITFGSPEAIPGGKALPYYACLAPGSKVLTADYQWVPVEELKVGQPIVGFDEFRKEGEKCRKMRLSYVEGNEPTWQQSYEIVTDRGTTTVASEAHLWLVNGGYPSKPEWVWKRTDELEDGSEIAWFAEPWDDDSQMYESAYLSGLFDGEGAVNNNMRTRNGNNRGWNITLAQNPGLVLDKALECLDKLGFDYKVYSDRKCHKVTIRGHLAERMRFLGHVRPVRLLNNLNGVGWDGAAIMPRGRYGADRPAATVTSIRPVGRRKVYAIGTSTKTLMVDGMFSHNSYRLAIRKTGKITRDTKYFTGDKWQSGKEQVGQKFKAEVLKSKLSKPFREVWFDWNLEHAQIDLPTFLVAQGVEHGLVKVRGNTWSFRRTSVVGRAKFITRVASDPALLSALEAAVRGEHGLPVPGTTPAPKKRLRKAQSRA